MVVFGDIFVVVGGGVIVVTIVNSYYCGQHAILVNVNSMMKSCWLWWH